MKTRCISIAVLLSVLLIFSACGDNKSKTAAGNTSVTSPGTPPDNLHYVAVGNNGTEIHSENGDIWNTASSSGTATANDISGISYDGSGLWVAIGVSGTVLNSQDGDNWIHSTDSGTTTINTLNNLFIKP